MGVKVSEEDEKEGLAYYAREFKTAENVRLKDEVELTKDDRDAVYFANDVTRELFKSYGLDPIEITPKQVHKIPTLKEQTGGDGAFLAEEQIIILGDSDTRIRKTLKLIHEIIHFKSYASIQVTGLDEEGDATTEAYRVGMGVGDINGVRRLNGFSEAVTETLTKRMYYQHRNHPYWSEETTKADRFEVFKPDKDGKIVPDDDKLVVTENGKQTEVDFGYPEQRENLQLLADKLYERNKEKFSSSNEVSEAFVTATLTGNLKCTPLSRPVIGNF